MRIPENMLGAKIFPVEKWPNTGKIDTIVGVSIEPSRFAKVKGELQCLLELKDLAQRLRVNQASMRNLIDEYGDETDEWLGKDVEYFRIRMAGDVSDWQGVIRPVGKSNHEPGERQESKRKRS